MLDGKKALAIAQQYVDDSLAGAGAVAGKPCQIQSITPITGGNRITFLWEDNNGVSHTQNLNVMDGAKGDKGDRRVTGCTTLFFCFMHYASSHPIQTEGWYRMKTEGWRHMETSLHTPEFSREFDQKEALGICEEALFA